VLKSPHITVTEALDQIRAGRMVVVVDDDEGLRMLLRTTFEIIDIDVEEALRQLG